MEKVAPKLNAANFLLILAKVLLTLAVSAILLIAGYLAAATWHADQIRPGLSKKITVKGSEFILRAGRGQAGENDGSIQISQPSTDERTLLTRNLHVEAADYPFIKIDLAGLNPGLIVYLIWRTADKPEELSHRRVDWQHKTSTTLNMSTQGSWTGKITEIGVDIYGDFRNDHITISEVNLLPYSSHSLVSAIWSEWSSFRGWEQKSINHLDRNYNQSLSPTVAVAAWMGLSILALTLPGIIKPSHRAVAYITAFLTTWIMLDLLWQHQLSLQLGETQFLFSGKTSEEKHLADIDADIYAYTQHLKKKFIPGKSSRIFILSTSKGHDFTRLKAQYYLLPMNIYNYGKYPPGAAVRTGDYILALTPSPQLRFDGLIRRLSWKKGQWLTVERIHQDPLGTLYRVLEPSIMERDTGSQGNNTLE